MATVITTGSAPKLLWPGLQAIWGDNYRQEDQLWRGMFDVNNSTKSYEEVQQLIGFGLAPVKEEGSSVQYDTWRQGFTTRYDNKPFSLGFIVTREQIADNQYKETASRRTRLLAFTARSTKEVVHANVYNRATTAGFVGGDGVTLLNAAHPTADGTQSNLLATAADLSETALEDLTIQIRNAENDRGLKIMIQPRKLIVAPAERYNATRILESHLRVGTTDNDANAMYNNGTVPEGWMDNPYLTDTDQWFVRTDCPESMTSFERDAIEFAEDNDFDTSNQKYKFYERYIPGWSDWRGLYGSPGV